MPVVSLSACLVPADSNPSHGYRQKSANLLTEVAEDNNEARPATGDLRQRDTFRIQEDQTQQEGTSINP